MQSESDLAYSTGAGRIKPETPCQPQRQNPLPKDGVVRVGRETQGRKGKGVTVVTGLPIYGDALEALARTLKRKLGTGGTLVGNKVEIQGDKRDAIVAELMKLGYTVRKVGG